MTTENITPACAGRERTCTHCGATYRSPRNSSRYCSTSCRQKANRGTAPTGGPKAGPEGWSIITKALFKAGYVGQVGPVMGKSKDAPVYALVVSYAHALDELSFQFNRRGWGYISPDEFADALRRDGIKPYQSRSEEAAELKLWKDCQRQREQRAA